MCMFLQLRKEEMDRKNRQAEEEEIEKMKAIQREKVQPKKLFTSDFLQHFCRALCYSYASWKNASGHLAYVWIQCFFFL